MFSTPCQMMLVAQAGWVNGPYRLDRRVHQIGNVKHGCYAAIHFPAVAEWRFGMIQEPEHQHFALPNRVAVEMLINADSFDQF